MSEKSINMKEILSDLFKMPRLFVSEMDFQFALGNKLKENFPQYEIYMGYRAQGNFYNEAMYIDIVLMNENEFIPIELKYKTKGIEKELSKELYKFKHHGAYPDNCRRYREDIRRIKRLKEHIKFKIGYAIFLTNDEKYIEKLDNEDAKFDKFENGYFCLVNVIKRQEV